MPRPARKAEPQEEFKAHTAESYRATQPVPNGPIAVVKTPARKGFANTFAFDGPDEMRTAFSLTHPAAEVDSVMRELADSASVSFLISH